MRLFLLFFLSFLFHKTTFAQTDSVIQIKSANDLISVGKQAFFLEDKTGKLSINDIQKPDYQKQFFHNEKDVFARPPAQNNYWIKLHIQNLTQEKLCLEMGSTYLWYIDYYVFDSVANKYVLRMETGAFRPEKNKIYDVNLYWLPLEATSKVSTVYINVRTQMACEIPMKIATPFELYQHKSNTDFIAAAFVGLMVIMFAYNLFLWFITRDQIYLPYLAYLFGISFGTSFFANYLFIVDFLELFFERNNIFLYRHIWNNWTYFFVVIFAIRFLDLKIRTPFFCKYLLFVAGIISFFLPFCNAFHLLPFYVLGRIFQSAGLLLLLSLLGVGLYLWIVKKVHNARFYSLAWVWFILSSLMLILVIDGVLPYNYLSRNTTFFGVALEVLMFSMALGDRINDMRREKEKLIREQNEVLEKKVKEKTLSLEEKTIEAQLAYETQKQLNEELSIQRELLENHNQELSLFRYKMSQSIESALVIQKAILPTIAKKKEILGEYFVINQPKDIVSGDFYWLNKHQELKFLIAADCTGHGVSGAFMTMIGNTLLDKIIKLQNIHQPATILEHLHQEIRQVLQQEKTGNTEGMDLGICVWKYENENAILTFAGAKRPLYYIKKGSKIEKIAGTRRSIGGNSKENKDFINENLILPKGSSFYMSSDGYADQNDLHYKRFSEIRLLELIEKVQDLPMKEQKTRFGQELDQQMRGTEQRDDILLIGVQL